MVNFKKVEVQNFMAIKEATLELDNQGLILIEGKNKSNDSYTSNGSGKSTLVSAITYALYGKTEKGLKADEVVNKIEKKNTFVKLDFTIGKDQYRIERYRKHKDNKNKVLLFLNDKEITGATNDVTDKQIQELFGIEFNTYVNAIMFGQGDIPMFSQATDKGKKEILESITRTDVYKNAQNIAKEKIKEVEESQNKLEMEINKKEFQLTSLEEHFEKDLVYYNQIQEKKEQEEKEVKRKTEKIEQQKKDIDKQIEEVKKNIPTVETKEYTFSENYYKTQETVKLLQEGINSKLKPKQQEVSNKINQITYEINTHKSRIQELDTSDTCPVCGSPIDNTHKVKEVDNLNNLIQQATDNLDKYQQAKELLDKKEVKLNDKIKGYTNTLTQEEEQSRRVEQENKDKLLNQQQYYNKISQLENQKNSLVPPTLNDYSYIKEPSKENHEKEVKSVKDGIDKYKQNILQLEGKKGKYKDAVEAFSNKGIRSVVLDFITPFLNEKANDYLQVLTGSDIHIEFQTQVENAKGELKDKFDVIVNNENGGKSYKANSAGEQKRIDLAISFAIQDLIMSKDDISTNIALYDECFDGLDLVGCENVIKLLKDRLKTVSTIFVITHNENLKSLFEQTITMVKEDGISRLEKGELK
nr:MAG TPA: STRUCTURAL MAINTENANCE OF CHROMOSOMES PROTEIN [Herelleviridae sp.]